MKKISLILALCILFTSLNAQRFGAKLGLNLATDKYEFSQTIIPTSTLAGLQTGVVFEMHIQKPWYFNTGLLYSQKGTKINYMSIDGNWRISYFEIPLNISYKYDLKTFKLYAEAGPYFGIGLSSKLKSESINRSIKFGQDNDEIKRTELGFNLGAGIEIKNIKSGINYGFGLNNLSNYSDQILKNRVFSISAAYLLKE
jgi:hypothetical protein